jgi:thiol-disulfide isomerase/thioredoxin
VIRRARVSLFLFLFSIPALAIETGMPVPSLSMQALDEGGATVTTSSLKGSVVYVDFWASWCVPCRLSMPALDELYRKNKSRGFAVVGVNKDATPAEPGANGNGKAKGHAK